MTPRTWKSPPKLTKGGKPRKVPEYREHLDQCAVLDWCVANRSNWPELAALFAVPNGELREPRVAERLRKEGVRPGVPDLFLLVPRGQYHGLVIEQKVKPNRPDREQRAWIAALSALGFRVVDSYSWNETVSHLQWYLALAAPPRQHLARAALLNLRSVLERHETERLLRNKGIKVKRAA